MKREFMEKWVAALRSGEYKQTTDRLCDGEGGYCCLGVLVEQAGRKFVAHTGEQGWPFSINNTSEDVQLTSQIMRKVGMSSRDGKPADGKPIIVNGLEYDCLAQANDEGRPFAQIADAIEASWERL